MANEIIIILVVVVIVAVIGFSIFQKSRRKKEQWTGVVIDKGYSETVRRDTTSRTGFRGSGRVNINIGGIGGMGMGNQNQPRHVSVNYYIVVKTETGEEIKRNVSEGFYQTVDIGDKIAKDSGTTIPKIIEKKTPSPSQ